MLKMASYGGRVDQDYNGTERRKFKRIVFSARDEVFGVFKLSGSPDQRVSYKIADISAGGLRFILPRGDDPTINIGDTISLCEITGKTKLELDGDIEMEVKWTMDHEMFQHIMVGCEFIHMTEVLKEQLEQFAESESSA